AAAALANRFPRSYEKSIGDQVFAAMKKDFDVDEGKTKYINDFFRQLNIPSDYQIRVTVVKGDVMNAFALPGGNIVVYDKIIHGISTYPALAALLSHEFTHVQYRHTVRAMLRQFGSSVIISLIAGDATAIGGVVVSHADELKGLSYSRRLEKEADDAGARILAERNISCEGFVQLFSMLKKEAGAPKTAEWMSSHPDLDKRIDNIRGDNLCKNSHPQVDSSLSRIFLQLKTAE
ncbi:MAG TPA: M48 family metallopeptidase, partial [Chitinophagaceae bacterium]|nr:M48 family metallopeptidase [Chitinophagaceae bacterium]